MLDKKAKQISLIYAPAVYYCRYKKHKQKSRINGKPFSPKTITIAAEGTVVIEKNFSFIQYYALCFKSSLYKLMYFRAEFSHEKSCVIPFRMIRFHSSGC
jgi:hypothetical protein